MSKVYIESKIFKGITELKFGEYFECKFENSNFANIDLSEFEFLECEFINCDLSMAKLQDTSLKDVKFINCKLQGVDFQYCNPFLFSVGFDDSILKLTSFYKLNLKKTKFKNCNIQEADFAEANLSQALFDNCDLSAAIFENTNLEKADFSTSFNYSFDAELNNIKKAKFSVPEVVGLLSKYDIKVIL